MSPTLTIVYTSETGHTARYARLLAEKTGLPVLDMEQAKKDLIAGAPVIYMGWLFASDVKGYKQAAKRFTVCAVCGVGLCPTGELLAEVRKTANIPDAVPLFTLQGGMDLAALKGINKFMISALTRFMRKKKNKTEGDAAMLALLETGGDYVDEGNLAAVLDWYFGCME